MNLLLIVGVMWLFLWIRVLVHESAHFYFIKKYDMPCFGVSVGGYAVSIRIPAFSTFSFGMSPFNGGCSMPGTLKRSTREWRNIFAAGPIAEILYGVAVLIFCSLFANSVFPYLAGVFIMCLLSMLEGAKEKGQDLNALRILSKTNQKELTLRQLFA